ncbi:hypothetical protein V8G54_005395 [Vigna mungo]|uniref:F-box domain-containing protein n=1 Tax=Vigna mungo TaxID=3915 RepID=A0AAQ3NYL3_VIGMU
MRTRGSYALLASFIRFSFLLFIELLLPFAVSEKHTKASLLVGTKRKGRQKGQRDSLCLILCFPPPFVTAGKVEAFCCAATEMVGKDNLRAEDLNLCFERLMMVAGSGNSEKGVNLKVGVITEWKDIPVELLMQILSLVDDQTVITASGVCRGWRDAIYFGLARLSLSWYIFLSLDAIYPYLLAFCFSPIGDFVM